MQTCFQRASHLNSYPFLLLKQAAEPLLCRVGVEATRAQGLCAVRRACVGHAVCVVLQRDGEDRPVLYGGGAILHR